MSRLFGSFSAQARTGLCLLGLGVLAAACVEQADEKPSAEDQEFVKKNLLSTAPNNYGEWSDPDFDQAVTQADKTLSNNTRISLYNQAEQIAIQNVGWLPLDHQALAAIIPLWVHGVSVNANGLFFGDWSQVYVLQH